MVEESCEYLNDPSLEYVDRFGRIVGDLLYRCWCSGTAAPTWNEVFASPQVMNFVELEMVRSLHPRKEALMWRAAGRGWVAYSEEPRSLRAGPTYLASQGRKLRVRQPTELGRRVADAFARFRYKHRHDPTFAELSYFIRNARVQRIFHGEADVLKSLPWLVVSGWIVLDGGRALRGPTAKADMNERAARSREAARARAAQESGLASSAPSTGTGRPSDAFGSAVS